MTRSIIPLAVVSALTLAAPAFAQATRTWVSGVGDDANPCSRTAPCKTFAGAISKTATNGEINVIDPGGFGAVTITKSITIDGEGPESSILAANTSGIIVNGAEAKVILRNLSINGAGTASGSGVRILNARSVRLDNVRISNFTGVGAAGRGVSIETAVANVRVAISDSELDNLGTVDIGSFPTAGIVQLDVANTKMYRAVGGSHGIHVGGNTKLTLTDSVIAGHLTGAAVALDETSSSAHISNSVLSNNQTGVLVGLAGGAPIVRLFGTVVTGNTVDGLKINSGSILSHGNNAIRGNAGNEVPTPPSLGQQ